MVALRGKKAKATATSRKAVEKAAAKQRATAAAAAAAAAASMEQAAATAGLPDLRAALPADERVRRLVAFLTRAGLALHTTAVTDLAEESGGASAVALTSKMVQQKGLAPFLDAMLTAACATGKDKSAAPTQILSRLTSASRKRVCGVIFAADEIAYSCRNCQVDSTCVICKECFMAGDHSGHDVYFQRTTAGSSCDCGDFHAWKRSGFCSRHPGVEEDHDGAKSEVKKKNLPKALATMAPSVVDAVVDFLFQVFLGIDQGFEFTEALELFSRDIPPPILSELAESRANPAVPPPAASVAPPASTTAGESRRRPRQSGSRRSSALIEAPVPASTSRTTTPIPLTQPPVQQLGIRLHNDDVHSLGEVINALCAALDCGKLQARATVSEADRSGDSIVATMDILKCIAPVGKLARGSLNVSVAPAWWEAQMERVPLVLEWLRTISMASDGLYEIVSDALRKKRVCQMAPPRSVSSIFAKAVSAAAFLKENQVRLHPTVQTLIEQLTKGDEGDLNLWSTEVERAFERMYRFRDVSVTGALPLRDGDRCDNALITELVKSVSLTREYSRHQSIRDGCAAVVRQFYVQRDVKAPASLLALMVRWDCALRKRTAHLGHALLREHMLNKTFRKCMLETYANSYGAMTASYLKGLGTSPESIFDFAVQFLTVPQLVKEYTRSESEKDSTKPQLAYEILAATEKVLQAAVDKPSGTQSTQPTLNVDHPALSSQKYKHCIDDLEYVFNVGAMPNELVCDDRNLALWVSSLKVLQNGDLQTRRGIRQSHVEYESDSWLSMFNLGIRIHSIFPVSWNGITPEILADRQHVVSRIFKFVIDAVINSSMAVNQATKKKQLQPIQMLRVDNSAVSDGSFSVYDFTVASAPTSLHVPLHRFLASSIRHVSFHVTWLQDVLEAEGLLSAFSLQQLSFDQRLELIELPLRSLVMASQIQSNLWRRNGEENMMAQLYNYSALPYCVHYRDADVFLLQVGILLLGPDTLLSLMIDRFQIGEFFIPDVASNRPDLAGQMGYTSREEGVDDQQVHQIVEEFLRLVIVLGTSLPSTSGEAYESLFMEEEMLQHLCAKPASFSKLFDVAMLPTGQDDVSVAKLEEVLTRVADFSPPSGLDPGRYELKQGLLEAYNPYFLHLNREAHELARDRWTNYRKIQRQKHRAKSSEPSKIAPLQRARRPLPFLRKARDILTSEATLAMVHMILWKLAQDSSSDEAKRSSSLGSSISDAVISTTLHLLVHGVYAAEDSQSEKGEDSGEVSFWTSLSSTTRALGDTSVMTLLWSLSDSGSSSSFLDEDQFTTLKWLLTKIEHSSTTCANLLKQFKQRKLEQNAKKRSSSQSGSTATEEVSDAGQSLEQRKDDARKRALAAMARQQAAFQAMMANMDEEEDEVANEEFGASHGDESESTRSPSILGKRRASVDEREAESEEQKRVRLSDAADEEKNASHKCILCHDTSTQGEMGVAAYVHQSTVLTGSFRPEPEEALFARGAEVRKQVKALIEKMDLCSGGPSVSTNSASPALRALAAQFPDWYMDDGFDEELMLDPPMPHLIAVNTQRQIRHNATNAGQPARDQRRRPGIEAFLMNDHDEDLEMLEGVLDLREDQRLFPLPIHGAAGVSPDRRDRGAARPLAAPLGVAGARRTDPVVDMDSDFDDDSDDLDEDDFQHHHHHHHHHNHHHRDHDHHRHVHHHLHQSPRRSRAGSRSESVPLHLTPCGLHIRTCQHAVHIHCLDRYIRSLHEKAIRGEDFDGVQAIDPDASMTQFLCPLCKTLCNFLIPTSNPAGSRSNRLVITQGDADAQDQPTPWYQIVEKQLKVPGWYRDVFGRDGNFGGNENILHDKWRDYFEETLWEPHGSLEKGAPYLWSACAFSLASFLNVAEDDGEKLCGSGEVASLTETYSPSLEKEFTSLVAVTKFCRWSFSLLEHSEDAKVIWETSKRCNPIHTETKREYRKFTKVLGSIDACLRGTILGLLVADTFTAFVISSVIADSLATIWDFIPVFSVADLLQRIHAEFFVQSKTDERSLMQDKFSIVEEVSASGGRQVPSVEESTGRPTRRSSRMARQANAESSVVASGSMPAVAKPKSARDVVRELLNSEANPSSEEYAVLLLLHRIIDLEPDETLKPLTRKDVTTRLHRIKSFNALLVRRMKLFWRCLSDSESTPSASAGAMTIPTVVDVATSPNHVFAQIWKWCVDRMNSKSFLATAKNGDKCEHAEGCGEGYIASMFILRDQMTKPRLIDLPVQYDELYGMMSGRKCARCEKTPCDPGICLICGEYLCCGDACCSHPYVNHGPQVGECTRHAAECGGGIGIVLMLDQCRVAVIGGSMAAHFPCPYVDAHGEEDVGLQRGRPLRLDTARYKFLESLWLNHRIFAEVSRQRNQRDPQFTINLSYL